MGLRQPRRGPNRPRLTVVARQLVAHRRLVPVPNEHVTQLPLVAHHLAGWHNIVSFHSPASVRAEGASTQDPHDMQQGQVPAAKTHDTSSSILLWHAPRSPAASRQSEWQLRICVVRGVVATGSRPSGS